MDLVPRDFHKKQAPQYSGLSMRVFKPDGYSHYQGLLTSNAVENQLVAYKPEKTARQAANQLVTIRSVNDVIIDHSIVLAQKRGDLFAL